VKSKTGEQPIRLSPVHFFTTIPEYQLEHNFYANFQTLPKPKPNSNLQRSCCFCPLDNIFNRLSPAEKANGRAAITLSSVSMFTTYPEQPLEHNFYANFQSSRSIN
jgi:hypothetical protein